MPLSMMSAFSDGRVSVADACTACSRTTAMSGRLYGRRWERRSRTSMLAHHARPGRRVPVERATTVRLPSGRAGCRSAEQRLLVEAVGGHAPLDEDPAVLTGLRVGHERVVVAAPVVDAHLRRDEVVAAAGHLELAHRLEERAGDVVVHVRGQGTVITRLAVQAGG